MIFLQRLSRSASLCQPCKTPILRALLSTPPSTSITHRVYRQFGQSNQLLEKRYFSPPSRNQGKRYFPLRDEGANDVHSEPSSASVGKIYFPRGNSKPEALDTEQISRVSEEVSIASNLKSLEDVFRSEEERNLVAGESHFTRDPPHEHMFLVVGGFIVVGIAVYLAQVIVERDMRGTSSIPNMRKLQEYMDKLCLSIQSIDDGRYYTLVTQYFLAPGFIHLVCRTFALSGWGPLAFRWFRLQGFLALYFGSAIAGSVCTLYAIQERSFGRVEQVVGGWGDIMGLMAACIAQNPSARSLALLGLLVGFSTAGTIGILDGTPFQNMDHEGDLGGIAFGLLFWLFVLRRGKAARYHSKLVRVGK